MKKLRGSVWVLGIVSFFNDIASEMLYPVMPTFITQVLGAPVAVLGLIDGVAEGSAAIFKTIFGNWSDQLGKRKPFIVLGYLTSTASKAFIALSRTWGLVFVGRVLDKFGKGVRTGARDALLLDASDATDRGLVFGVQQGLDSGGAVVGPLIALALLQAFNNDIRTVLYVAIIPSLIGVLIVSLVHEPTPKVEDLPSLDEHEKGQEELDRTGASPSPKTVLNLNVRSLPRELKIFVLANGLFALGNSSDSFLILRSEQVGLSLSLVIVAYVIYNAVYSLASPVAGAVADKIGPKRVYVAGVVIYLLVYLGFALNTSTLGVWLLFAIYGLYIAQTDSVSRALVGQYIAGESNAAGTYGLLQSVISIGLVAASVIGGILWSAVGSWATFAFAASCATASLLVFLLASRNTHTTVRGGPSPSD